MADVTRSAAGARRACEAVLRSSGTRAVNVLVPRPATAGVVGEQLGLASPEFDQKELAPVLLRLQKSASAGSEAVWEMLVPSAPLEELAGTGVSAVRAFLAGAQGLMVDDALLRIVEVSYRDCAGEVFLYRIRLQSPGAVEI